MPTIGKISSSRAARPSRSFCRRKPIPPTFGTPVKYSAGLTPVWVVAGDLNSDGSMDLAVVNAGAMDGTGGSASILLQNPATHGTFLTAGTFDTGRSATFL